MPHTLVFPHNILCVLFHPCISILLLLPHHMAPKLHSEIASCLVSCLQLLPLPSNLHISVCLIFLKHYFNHVTLLPHTFIGPRNLQDQLCLALGILFLVNGSLHFWIFLNILWLSLWKDMHFAPLEWGLALLLALANKVWGKITNYNGTEVLRDTVLFCYYSFSLSHEGSMSQIEPSPSA